MGRGGVVKCDRAQTLWKYFPNVGGLEDCKFHSKRSPHITLGRNFPRRQSHTINPLGNRGMTMCQHLNILSDYLTVQECVKVIANLTDIFLRCALEGVQIALDDEQSRIISKHRRFHRQLALHLDDIVLQKEKHPNLEFCDKQKPYAKLSKSILGLAEGMRDDVLVKDYFVTPEILWLSCHIALCRDSLEKDGLLASLGLDKKIPYLPGKKEIRDNNKSLMNSLDVNSPFDEENFKKTTGWTEATQAEMEESIWYNPLAYLTTESFLKAIDEPEFDAQYFHPYQRAWASIRNATKSSDIQYSGIDAYGNLQFSEPHTNRRNKRIP